jgi:Zinc finger, C3HC4 type (RING finger)
LTTNNRQDMSLTEPNEKHLEQSSSSMPSTATFGECDDEYIWMNLLSNNSKDSSQSTSSSSWDDLCTGLKNLDRSLRCGICINICHAPVSIIGCNHTYCSECIRAHFQSELQMMTRAKKVATCPDCRTEVDTSGRIPYSKCLAPNRLAERVCDQFQQIRPLLYNILSKKKYRSSSQSTDPISVQSLKRSDNNTRTIEKINDNKVQREPLRPVLYTAHKRKALQEMCEKVGLATHGSEKELKQRHEAYINLYNADCDSSHPRSARSIADEINRREKAKMYNHTDYRTSQCIENLKVSRAKIAEPVEPGIVNNKASVTLTSGSKSFDDKLNNNYKLLIQQVKEQKLKEKEKLSKTILDNAADEQNDDNNIIAEKNDVQLVTKLEKVEANTETERVVLNANVEQMELDTKVIEVFEKDANDNSNEVVFTTPTTNDYNPLQHGQLVDANLKDILCFFDNDTMDDVSDETKIGTIDESALVANWNENKLTPVVDPSINSSTIDVIKRTSSISPDNVIPSRKRSVQEIVEIDDIEKDGTRKHKTFLNLLLEQREAENVTNNRVNGVIDLNSTNGESNRRRDERVFTPSLIGPWNCTRCTFRNNRNVSSVAICAMCDEPRPSPRRTSIT